MRLPVLVCLLSLFCQAGRAASIDDFLLTGPGLNVTYSLPATSSYPDFSLFNFFSESAPADINGVSGLTVTGAYYDTAFYPYASLVYSLPSSTLVLHGGVFIDFAFVAANNPFPYYQEDVVPTFLPGTYTLYQMSPMGGPSIAYSLTITPETSTPEPSSLLLLATGALGLLGTAGRRRDAVQRGLHGCPLPPAEP
jgi:hypothetical protein